MISIVSGISFDFLPTWKRFTEGSRCIFHTPQREEIIVSVNRIDGTGPATERSQLIERAFANGLDATKRSAAHPDLRIVKPLAEENGICTFRYATVLAETAASDAFFGQAVIQHPQGIVFLTYEAPFRQDAEHTFHDLLRRVHAS